MANNYFSFKQFTVTQNACAMKVCTDACILGAWVAANIQHASHVLDIGTGTGLLSLMYAQKNPKSIIDAVEMDEPAAEQATENFRASNWNDRISAYHSPIQKFSPGKKYNLIITNPPFFENDLLSVEETRNTAMHSTSLTLQVLSELIMEHLAPSGKLAVLLPYHRTEYFTGLMKKSGLNLASQLLLKQTSGHTFFRSILCFSNAPGSQSHQHELIIKNTSNTYSDEFIRLLKDYYLYL